VDFDSNGSKKIKAHLSRYKYGGSNCKVSFSLTFYWGGVRGIYIKVKKPSKKNQGAD
jgi:hypothetical protein